VIADKTTLPILQADENVRAPDDQDGTYICLFAYHAKREALIELAETKARSPKTLLKQIDQFKNEGGHALWKGGEVEAGNLFMDRLDTLSSGVNTGGGKVPTAAKMHQLVLDHGGGHVLVMMIPVWGYKPNGKLLAERVMMIDLSEKYGMNFDNLSRGRGGRKVKKDWLEGKKLPFDF
jgi:hypothetical protein